jgi:hypothetical protein
MTAPFTMTTRTEHSGGVRRDGGGVVATLAGAGLPGKRRRRIHAGDGCTVSAEREVGDLVVPFLGFAGDRDRRDLVDGLRY